MSNFKYKSQIFSLLKISLIIVDCLFVANMGVLQNFVVSIEVAWVGWVCGEIDARKPPQV